MRVVLINRSDQLGGAAIATLRLMHGLRQQGVDARMVVVDQHGSDQHVALAGNTLTRRWAFLAERLGIYLCNGRCRDTLFKIDTATHGIDVSRHPWVREADALLLGWTNQGMLSLHGIERLAQLGKPIVWTLHDMWPCTGVCHHAYECRGYLNQCAECPLLPSGSTLAAKTLRRKAELYSHAHIHFVAVSHWLARCCRQSTLLRDQEVTVIGNPFPTSDYSYDYNPRPDSPDDAIVIAMGAARLDDPVKGFDLLIAAMRHLHEQNPNLAHRVHLLLYGDLRDMSLLDQLPVAHTHLGYITDINALLRQAHIVLSTSRYESFGYTLLEGMASGCIPVTTGAGGQADIVPHLQGGYIAGAADPADVAHGIEWAVKASIDRAAQHQWVAEHFDAQIIAKKYLNIINQMS
ncbi:MAG: glycosyltransferase [Muribaculaceae bacterium]|nr:glycosyltransferase [Muribaculaceae bacterium]